MRFVPAREDLATPESWAKPISTRGAIEAMPEGCIAVADAMGITSAGIFGDILTMRMMKRNVTALVTDGAVRDKAGVLASKLPTWCNGAAAPASVNGLTFVGWEEPIGCGGCAVFPGDVIVCDDDGAVVIPQNLVSFVAEEGAEHERMETWIVSEVERGAKLPGLYPMNDEAKARYEAWKTGSGRRELSDGTHVLRPLEGSRLLRHSVQPRDGVGPRRRAAACDALCPGRPETHRGKHHCARHPRLFAGRQPADYSA